MPSTKTAPNTTSKLADLPAQVMNRAIYAASNSDPWTWADQILIAQLVTWVEQSQRHTKELER